MAIELSRRQAGESIKKNRRALSIIDENPELVIVKTKPLDPYTAQKMSQIKFKLKNALKPGLRGVQYRVNDISI
jgi:hypothetical protein